MFRKHAYKQVSVEGMDNSRNATEIPRNLMIPACVNKIMLLEKPFQVWVSQGNHVPVYIQGVFFFFQGVSVSRWIGIFSSYICCLKPRFYVSFFLYAYLLGEPAFRTFLTIAFLVHTCRKHDICGYICRVSTITPCLNTDLFICVFFEHLLLDGTCFFIHVSCFIPRIYGRCCFISICCRKPHLEHVSNLSYLPHMQERESARKECHFLSFFQRHVLPFHVPVNMCRELFLGILREYI